MKKLTLASLFFLGFFALMGESQAEYTGVCIQKTQAAISQNGECKTFSNPCSVPRDWRHISSCDENQNAETGKSIEEINKRRFDINKWKRRRSTTKITPKKRTLKRTISGGSWNRRTAEKADLSEQKNRRTFSKRRYYSRKNLIKTNEKTSETETALQNNNRKRLATASGPRKRGSISTTKWSTRKNNHFRTKDYSKKRAWKSITSINNKKRASKRKLYRPRSAQLHKVWVGERRAGNLDSSTSATSR